MKPSRVAQAAAGNSTGKYVTSIRYIKVRDLFVDHKVQQALNASRAQRIADNHDPNALGVIAVSHRADGTYHVIDGQHRWHGTKLRHGEDYELRCEVYEGLTLAEEAHLFRVLNDKKNPNVLALFNTRLVEREEVATGIRVVVERAGWRIAHHLAGSRHDLYCVAAAERVYRKDPKALGLALMAISRAWGTDSPVANDARLVEGLGRFFARYGESVDLDDLARKLSMSSGGPTTLIGRARGIADQFRTTVPDALAEAVVSIYNTKRRTRALPPWRS